ncbi:hypothetical protein Gotur_007497 [Gossypium turneri]
MRRVKDRKFGVSQPQDKAPKKCAKFHTIIVFECSAARILEGNYWRDYDTALFILKHLYRDIPEDPNFLGESIEGSLKDENASMGWSDERETIDEELPLTFSDRDMLIWSRSDALLLRHTVTFAVAIRSSSGEATFSTWVGFSRIIGKRYRLENFISISSGMLICCSRHEDNTAFCFLCT